MQVPQTPGQGATMREVLLAPLLLIAPPRPNVP